jgi:predicted Ser/Thr protein kinase
LSEPLTPKKLGRYEIVRELGKGAMGVVYEGRDPNIGRRVAIKTARRDVLERSPQAAEMLERFLREAKAAGALSHPNIITIYDAAEEEGMAYIAMEFLEGGDLRDVIEARRKLDPEEIAELGATICEALATAHTQGVIHRDIKPANILMPTNAPLKVADFGIAHVQDSTLTQDGALIGTPYYMSPEQFMGQKVDGRSDLFSAGIIVYELLTGEKPFTGEAVSTIMQHVIRTMPVPPQDLNFNCPTPLSQVIMKALAKRPAERYQDGRAMAAALRESVKPNPDTAILGLVSSGVDHAAATVVTEAAGAATVVAGAGVASSPAPEDLAATTPTGTAAPGASATIQGTPPPGATAAGMAGVTGNAYAPPTVASRARLTGIIGAVALVLALLAFAIGPLFGEKTPEEGGATTVNAETENGEPGQPETPAKWIANVAVQIFLTANAASLLDFDYKKSSLPDDAQAIPGHVTIKDAQGAIIETRTVDESGAFISLPGNQEKIIMEWYGTPPGAPKTGTVQNTWYAEEAAQKIGMDDTALLTVSHP